jgi:hypothetical protein
MPGTRLECDAILLVRSGVFLVETKGWTTRHLLDGLPDGNQKWLPRLRCRNPVDTLLQRACKMKGLLRRSEVREFVHERLALPNADLGCVPIEWLRPLNWDREGGEIVVVDSAELGSPGDTRARFRGKASLSDCDLAKAEAAIRGIVHEDQRFERMASPQAVSALAAKQREIVDWPTAGGSNRGRRLLSVQGCAGSGKTLVALHRAWEAARQGRSVLLACCNRSLEAKLRETVTHHGCGAAGSIEVRLAPAAILAAHNAPEADELLDLDRVFDEVAAWLYDDETYRDYAQIGRERGDPIRPAVVARELVDIWALGFQLPAAYLEWSRRRGRFLDPKGDELHDLCWAIAGDLGKDLREAKVLRKCAALIGTPVERAYNEVIVDEAQDAYGLWLDGLAELVTCNGNLVVLHDRSQAVHRLAMPLMEWYSSVSGFGEKKWESIGANYRFPDEVFNWCVGMRDRDEVLNSEAKECGDWEEPRVPCGLSAPVQCARAWSREHATCEARAFVEQVLSAGDSCAVFYVGQGSSYAGRSAEHQEAWLDLQNRYPAKLEVAPVGGLRGLEFDEVVLLGFNDTFPEPKVDAESWSLAHRMFQVAVTRTRRGLRVFHWSSEPSSFVSALLAAAGPRTSEVP